MFTHGDVRATLPESRLLMEDIVKSELIDLVSILSTAALRIIVGSSDIVFTT